MLPLHACLLALLHGSGTAAPPSHLLIASWDQSTVSSHHMADLQPYPPRLSVSHLFELNSVHFASLSPNACPLSSLHFEPYAWSQGNVTAVSRIIPRAHLPRREPEVASAPMPMYEGSNAVAPPFLIQSCKPDGSSADWALLQCFASAGSIQPVLYRHASSRITTESHDLWPDFH